MDNKTATKAINQTKLENPQKMLQSIEEYVMEELRDLIKNSTEVDQMFSNLNI